MRSITSRYFPRCRDLLSMSTEYLQGQGVGCTVQLVGKRINLCPKVKTASSLDASGTMPHF